jgi:hypothetical protein
MAWNPAPEVAHARDFARKFNKRQVVILFVQPDGRAGYASYGETKALCADAGKLADAALEAIEMERSLKE